MSSKHPTPQVPAAYQALYGRQAENINQSEDNNSITFDSALTKQELSKTNQSLLELNKLIRIAASICHRDHQQLTSGFGNDEEMLLVMIEGMKDLTDRLSGLSELAGSAHARMMIIAQQSIQDAVGGES